MKDLLLSIWNIFHPIQLPDDCLIERLLRQNDILPLFIILSMIVEPLVHLILIIQIIFSLSK